MKKLYTFDDLPEVGEIELELDYDYTFIPGYMDGLPENCYPAEEECEIRLVDGWEQHIMNCYIAAAQQAIKVMSSKIADLEFINAPRQWVKENQ